MQPPSPSRRSAPVLVLLFALAGAACAHAPAPTPVRRATTLRATAPDGAVLPESAWLGPLAEARVVCFGERHDDVSDHAAEVELARLLADLGPGFAIGLEMVERPMQSVLDAWVAGTLEEAALLDALAWSTRWGFDFGLYRDLFVLARERSIPLLALNARREVVRRVMQVGAEAARTELGDEVPELGLADPAYRTFVAAALEGHAGMGEERLGRFVEAQRTWDETMASVVATDLARPDGPSRILVVAGAFHCAYALGIPSALARRGIAEVRVVLGAGVDLPEVQGRAKADFVVESASP